MQRVWLVSGQCLQRENIIKDSGTEDGLVNQSYIIRKNKRVSIYRIEGVGAGSLIFMWKFLDIFPKTQHNIS